MRIFLTGGTGFVGGHVIEKALADGHEVVALRRSGSRSRRQLKAEPTWVEGTLDQDLTDSLKGCGALVHLSSHTPNPPYAPLDQCLYWNVYAPIKLAMLAHECGVNRYLIAGSCFEYGDTAQGGGGMTSASRLQPSLSYPTSKAAATLTFEGFCRQNQILLKNLRLFQIFGEGEQETRMWPSLRRAAFSGADFPMTSGQQIRDFINVVDAATAIVAHLDFSSSIPGQPTVHPIASGKQQTLLEFAQEWWAKWEATGKLLPGRINYRDNEIMELFPDLENW